MNTRRKRADNGRHAVRPIWRDKFDANRFAKALIMAAMHLDEISKKAHTKSNEQAIKGGGHHE